MNDITLLYSTGVQKIDRALQSVIGLYELIFPGRIRAYYLVGSYADGSATAASDIDLQIWFKDGFVDQAEKVKARQVYDYCWSLSYIDLDIGLIDETLEIRLGFPKIKLTGVLIYGEDIRDKISLMPIDRYQRLMMHAPYRFMTRVRGNPERMIFPLDYPDPQGEFYGYDWQEIPLTDGTTTKGMKELIMATGVAASALISLKAGVYTEKKGELVRLYQEHINDEWTPLLSDIYEKCNKQWGYLIPEAETDRQELRRLCRQALAFENHFLTIYKGFLLTELAGRADSGGWFSLTQARSILAAFGAKLPETLFEKETALTSNLHEPLIPAEIIYQLLAIKALAKMIYPDEKVLGALERLRNSRNDTLRQAADEAIQKIVSSLS